MHGAVITDQEFTQLKNWIYQQAGISLSKEKKALVCSRLTRRLNHYHLTNYTDYFKLLMSGSYPHEPQIAVDLLTTNETYFFREPKHFQFLSQQALKELVPGKPFRVWSAASSYGQEAYSIAMVLADRLGGRPWEVFGSDISSRVLEKACTGHYPIEQTQHIPKHYLTEFCLKGTGAQEGTFLIASDVRKRTRFEMINLTNPLPDVGEFDVIFLRNVMIYFDLPTKREVIKRLDKQLRPGGYLFIGHSESLNGIYDELEAVAPAIYKKS
ncbi:CheR family methyltransferase [Leeia oryzae]|uniref:CheR family methyltransferase n=1 Tax=Leeia oryzae TaxID=356662 RepID=UPI00037B8B13|nr:protein-glutamate O-methyltransferase CheR [Leeia oryzae]